MNEIVKAEDIDQINSEAAAVRAEAVALAITDESSAMRANDILARSKGWLKKTKADRDKVLKPVKDSVKAITEMYASGIDIIENVIDIVGGKVLSWTKAEQARRDAEERERLEKLAAIEAQKATATATDEIGLLMEQDEIESAPVLPAKAAVHSDYGMSSISRRWAYKIVVADDVPREYCEPAVGKIRAAVNAGVREIKGVEIYQEESLTTRR